MMVGTEAELVLYDRQIIPERRQKDGFQFQFDTIRKALKDLAQISILKTIKTIKCKL